MDGIKAWAIALCAAAVGCSLLHMLAPKGGMGRLFKLIIAAFFLCCMIAPLMNLKSMTLPELTAVLGTRVPRFYLRNQEVVACDQKE